MNSLPIQKNKTSIANIDEEAGLFYFHNDCPIIIEIPTRENGNDDYLEEEDIEFTSTLLQDMIVSHDYRNNEWKQQHQRQYTLRKSLWLSNFVGFIILVVLLGATIVTNSAIFSRRGTKGTNIIMEDIEFPTDGGIYSGPMVSRDIATPHQNKDGDEYSLPLKIENENSPLNTTTNILYS